MRFPTDYLPTFCLSPRGSPCYRLTRQFLTKGLVRLLREFTVAGMSNKQLPWEIRGISLRYGRTFVSAQIPTIATKCFVTLSATAKGRSTRGLNLEGLRLPANWAVLLHPCKGYGLHNRSHTFFLFLSGIPASRFLCSQSCDEAVTLYPKETPLLRLLIRCKPRDRVWHGGEWALWCVQQVCASTPFHATSPAYI